MEIIQILSEQVVQYEPEYELEMKEARTGFKSWYSHEKCVGCRCTMHS